MKIRTQDYDDVTIVELQGRLAGDFIESFENTITDIIAAHKTGIVIDMSDVRFIDSAGLEQLLWLRNYCSENNCQLRLAGLSETLRKILEITRLENKFGCCAELTEAIKSFA